MFSNLLNNEILICILLLIVISYLQNKLNNTTVETPAETPVEAPIEKPIVKPIEKPAKKPVIAEHVPEQTLSVPERKIPKVKSISFENINDINKIVPNKLKFVLYFAHWCGHCKNFLPIWKEFKKNNTNPNLEISEVDCEADSETCNNNNINGFPTVILYKNGQSHEYSDERSINALNTFVNKFI